MFFFPLSPPVPAEGLEQRKGLTRAFGGRGDGQDRGMGLRDTNYYV